MNSTCIRNELVEINDSLVLGAFDFRVLDVGDFLKQS